MAIQLTRARRGLLAGAILIAAVLTGGSASAVPADEIQNAVDVPSEPITLNVVTVNGSGCPAGIASVRRLADGTGFSVRYSNFVAAAGGSARPTDFRKNCQLNLRIHVPQGFTYAIARVDYAGTANLAAGASALKRANYYFTGSAINNYADRTFTGPLSGRWRDTDTATQAELVYAPCGVDRNININSELRVYKGTSSAAGSIRMTSTDGGVDTIYRFSWKRCP
jgi:uncharacterized protein DUF4360